MESKLGKSLNRLKDCLTVSAVRAKSFGNVFHQSCILQLKRLCQNVTKSGGNAVYRRMDFL
jgi:hypothetical protein